MNALASAHKPGKRLSELSPFDLELQGAVEAQSPLPESAFGCVEWFHYPEHPAMPPASGEQSPRPGRPPAGELRYRGTQYSLGCMPK
jgi:hypothetical protein